MRLKLVAWVVVLLAASCSQGNGPDTPAGDPVPVTTQMAAGSTTTAEPTVPVTQPVETTLPEPGEGMRYAGKLLVPEVLEGFGFGSIWLDGQELVVGIADTSELRRHGLMFVEDLGDLDGMVFIFERDSTGGFWMKNTLIPLDIAFFDSEGRYVDGFVMEPCRTADCPSYVPSGRYRYALEMAAGAMAESPQLLSLVEPES